tara:strand:+ start:494 stop:751 length:258 start_codon:yes stop_codon:yes gene_type:complete
MACRLGSLTVILYFDKGERMPKLKTKSSIKKRFARTGTGKIKFKPSGKKHGMSKRSNKFVRTTRRSSIMAPGDAALIDHMLPYNK